MDAQALLLLIRQKLQDGRLPRKSSITRAWSFPSDGERCNVYDTLIAKDQLVKEVTLASGRGARGAIPFHVVCFQLWDIRDARLRRARRSSLRARRRGTFVGVLS